MIIVDGDALLNFIDTEVREAWIESCKRDSSWFGYSKQIYVNNDGDFLITGDMSNNSYLYDDNLMFISSIASYIDLDYEDEITDDDIVAEWDYSGRDCIVDKIDSALSTLDLEIYQNYIGKTWGELSSEEQDALLKVSNIWEDVPEGDCIVDFYEHLSVGGEVINNDTDTDCCRELVIKDSAILYDSQNM